MPRFPRRARRLSSSLLASLLVVLTSAPATEAGSPPVLAIAPASPIAVTSTGSNAYSFGTLVGSATQAFTVTNSGGSATAALVVTLSESTAFTKTADGCSAVSLGPKKSCTVTIGYTPTTATDTATLTVASNKPSASATITLAGSKGVVTTLQNAANATIAPASSVAAGTIVHDVATISTGSSQILIPSGSTVTFHRYATIDCTGASVDQTVSTPSGTQTAQVASASFTPAAGSYAFEADFTSGDPTMVSSATSSCEPFTVVDASISIAPPSGTSLLGTAYTFTITVTGLPASTTTAFTSITPSVTPTPASSSTTCAAPTISGNVATCTFTITSSTATAYTANASAAVTVNGVALTRSTSGTAGPGGSGPAGVTYIATADLSITKTDNVTSVAPGTTDTYTLAVANAGPSAVSGATVTDTLPVGLLDVSSPALPAGVTFTDLETGQVTWTGLDLASGGSVSLTLTGSVDPALAAGTGTFIDTATVQPPAGVADPNPANNTTTDTDGSAPQVDLAVSATDGTTSVTPGTTETYTLTVSNAGPAAVSGATVIDTLPTGFLDVASPLLPAGVTFTDLGNGQVEWSALDLGSGTSETLTLTGSVDPTLASGTNTFTDVAAVQPPAGVTDTSVTNDTATDTDSVVPQASLAIATTVDGAASEVANVGQAVTFGILVTNTGPSAATGTTVNDLLPPGLTFVNDLVPAGTTYDPNTGVWAIGTVALGSSRLLVIVAQVVTIGSTVPSSINQTATASAADATSVSSTAVVTVNAALSLTKAVSAGDAFGTPTTWAAAGSDVTYELTVTNTGGTSATNVVVTDDLPAAFTLQTASISPSAGTAVINGGVLTWTVGSLAAGASATLAYTETTNAPASAQLDTNSATVTSTETTTYGTSDPAAASASASLEVRPSADLAIALTDGRTSVTPGTSDTYTLTVTNAGPSAVGGASVLQTLPVGLLDVSSPALPAGVTFTDLETGQVAWTGLDLASGASVSLTLSGTVDPALTATSFSTSATVQPPAGVTDPDTANNSATDTDSSP